MIRRTSRLSKVLDYMSHCNTLGSDEASIHLIQLQCKEMATDRRRTGSVAPVISMVAL